MLIAQISDTHIEMPDSGEEGAVERLAWFRRAVADINTLSPLPDVVLHTGDMAQNGRDEEYHLIRECLSKLKMPYYVTPGNRDRRRGIIDFFTQSLGQENDIVHYAIDKYPVRLVCVDTQGTSSFKGDMCTDRLSALDKTLKIKPDEPTALFLHHPSYEVPESGHKFQFERQEGIQDFTELVSAHKQIKHIFCGHIHRFSHAFVAHAPASTVPSLALDRRIGVMPPYLDDTPAYMLHHWDGFDQFISSTRLVQ